MWALPTIARELSAAPAYTVWVVNGYQLAIVVSLLPLAALGEKIGYRRVFLCGHRRVYRGFGSLRAVTEPVDADFHAGDSRVGAAGVMSVNGALLRYTYPPSLLGRGVGLNALVVSAAAALGPTVAAGVLAVGPWEWLFAINVPIGVVAILMGSALPANPQDGKFDIVSTCLNILTFGLAFTGIDALTRGGEVWFGCTEIAFGRARRRRVDHAVQGATSSARAGRPLEEQALRDDGADFNRLLRRANAGFCFLAVLFPGRAASKPGRHRTSDDALAAGGRGCGVLRRAFGGQAIPPAILSGGRARHSRSRSRFAGPHAHTDDFVRNCGIDGDLRAGLWLLPGAEQSDHAFVGAHAKKWSGSGDARDGAAHRSDDRRDHRGDRVSLRGTRRDFRARRRRGLRIGGGIG